MTEAPKSPASAQTTLRDRVPSLSDAELASLFANAQRLTASGTNQQRAAATDLLPVIEAEISERKAARAAMRPKTPRATKKTRAKTAAAGID